MTCLRIRASSSPEGRLPGRKSDSTGLGRGRLEDVDGLEAVVVIMGVEQRQLLAAVDGVAGIVDVEDDTVGNKARAFAEQIDHRQPHAPQLAPRRRVLEARQGRLAHQIIARLGQAPTGQLERRIETQYVEVVAVLIAAGDGEHPRSDHVGVGVGRACRIAPIGQTAGKPCGNAKPFLNAAQQQHTTVG